MFYGMKLSSDNLMQFVLSKVVCILLKINFHAFLWFLKLFYIFVTGVSEFLETKYVFHIENGFRCS
jgi:hypothetical protein